MKQKCSVHGCSGGHYAKSFCRSHYYRSVVHGNPEAGRPAQRAPGTGGMNAQGYVVFQAGGRTLREHVLVVEKAMGTALPAGAVVHHVDGNRSNNAPANLVVCPGQAYHMLLHARQRALVACGDANKRRCPYCGRWDLPERLYTSATSAYHRECYNHRRQQKHRSTVRKENDHA